MLHSESLNEGDENAWGEGNREHKRVKSVDTAYSRVYCGEKYPVGRSIAAS